MYLLQGLIVFAVVGSNIHWQWTPNPYIPPMFGFILAYGVTWLIVEFRDRWYRFGWSKRLIFHRARHRRTSARVFPYDALPQLLWSDVHVLRLLAAWRTKRCESPRQRRKQR